MPDGSQHGKGLFSVFVWATALSFGTLAAIACSMKNFFGGNASFQFSYKTIVGFVIGGVVGWIFWVVIDRVIRTRNKK